MDATWVGPLHHVTVLSGDPGETRRFYEGVLGLRLVKRTVNFDDPGSYHLYFGDEQGRPGTILTFFPWPLAVPGQPGPGQCTSVRFRVEGGSLPEWTAQLEAAGVAGVTVVNRFGTEALAFDDPHGLSLELVRVEGVASEPSGAPSSLRVSGLDGVTLTHRELAPTARVLEFMGYSVTDKADDRVRFRGREGAEASVVDVSLEPAAPRGRVSRGSVHHIAFQLRNDEAQADWKARLAGLGLPVSPVMDRKYFRSIYFNEPGGVLFELATDGPGFAVDEPADQLGRSLQLPPQYESRRDEIEAHLPPLPEGPFEASEGSSE